MSTWSGWQSDLLDAAKLPNTRTNRSFLTAWNKSQPTKCNRNPLFISHEEPGSTRCRQDTYTGRWARNYISIVSAGDAFDFQIHGTNYTHLLAALETGDPYSIEGEEVGRVATNLRDWGLHDFAQAYYNGQQNPHTTLSSPQALAGWKALRRAFNRGMPSTLNHATRVNKQTLRTLHRARKVRI